MNSFPGLTKQLSRRFKSPKPAFPVLTIAGALLVSLAIPSSVSAAPPAVSLVPDTPNTSPDYFCTWNSQGYYSSYASGAEQKDAVRESRLFGM